MMSMFRNTIFAMLLGTGALGMAHAAPAPEQPAGVQAPTAAVHVERDAELRADMSEKTPTWLIALLVGGSGLAGLVGMVKNRRARQAAALEPV